MKPSFKKALFYGLFLFTITQAAIMIFPPLVIKLSAPGSLLTQQAEILVSLLHFMYWLCIPLSKLVGSAINGLVMTSHSAVADSLRLPLLRFLDLLFWIGFSLVILKTAGKGSRQNAATKN